MSEKGRRKIGNSGVRREGNERLMMTKREEKKKDYG